MKIRTGRGTIKAKDIIINRDTGESLLINSIKKGAKMFIKIEDSDGHYWIRKNSIVAITKNKESVYCIIHVDGGNNFSIVLSKKKLKKILKDIS